MTTDSLNPEYTSELALSPQDTQVPIVIYMEIHPTRTIECCQTIKIGLKQQQRLNYLIPETTI